LLLNQGDFLEWKLDSEITAGHHDGVRRVQDAAEVLDGRVFLDLGHQLHAARC
jgi:hypothetical protein